VGRISAINNAGQSFISRLAPANVRDVPSRFDFYLRRDGSRCIDKATQSLAKVLVSGETEALTPIGSYTPPIIISRSRGHDQARSSTIGSKTDTRCSTIARVGGGGGGGRGGFGRLASVGRLFYHASYKFDEAFAMNPAPAPTQMFNEEELRGRQPAIYLQRSRGDFRSRMRKARISARAKWLARAYVVVVLYDVMLTRISDEATHRRT